MDLERKLRSVCFTGHRRVERDFDLRLLRETVVGLIEKGYDTFICGGALGFDTVAANLIIELKKEYKINLYLYLPCRDQDSRWSYGDRREYNRILRYADLTDMPGVPYYDGCMRDRNYKMVDSADVCVCYLSSYGRSGTAQTVRYAQRRGLQIINVASPQKEDTCP